MATLIDPKDPKTNRLEEDLETSNKNRPPLQDQNTILVSGGETKILSESGLTEAGGVETPCPITIIPEIQGRYQFQGGRESAEIGRGGIGRVLLATDTNLNRAVAVKELLVSPQTAKTVESDLESAQFLKQIHPIQERFFREAQITGQLSHPNIVPVYELGQKPDGTYYYTMKYVRGKTFSQELSSCKNLSDRLKLLSRFLDLCQAIAYAHSKGVIHRDIKPENVVIGEFGETIVLDWGIAKYKKTASTITRPISGSDLKQSESAETFKTVDGSRLGTPAFMSPEQAAGRISDIDERTDVWSLGIVLYLMLTGLVPFNGENIAEILEQVINSEVTPPKTVDKKVPIELNAICLKALQKDRQKRYAQAHDFAKEIEAYLAGKAVEAYEYSSWEHLKRFIAKNRILVGAASLVLLTGIFAFFLIWRANIIKHERFLVANYHMAEALNKNAEALISEKYSLSALVYTAASLYYNPAHINSPFYQGGFEKKYPDSRFLLTEAVSKACSLQFRLIHGLSKVIHHPSFTIPVSISPNGRYVAFNNTDRSITLFDLQTQKVQARLRGHTDLIQDIIFSKKEPWLISTGRDNRIIIWNLHTGKPLRQWKTHLHGTSALTLSVDETYLFSSGTNGLISIWDLKTSKEIGVLKGHADSIFDLKVSPDNKQLASCSMDKTIKLWDIETWTLMHTFEGHLQAINSIAFSPDSKILASASLDQTIKLWRVETGQEILTLRGHRENISALRFLNRLPILASIGVGKTLRFWYIGGGNLIQTLEAHDSHIGAIWFSPKDDQVISAGADQTIKYWEIREYKKAKILPPSEHPIRKITFSDNGKYLASLEQANIIRIFEVKTASLLTVIQPSDITFEHIAFSPDGRQLAALVHHDDDDLLIIYDTRTGSKVTEILTNIRYYNPIAFFPNGEQVAILSDDLTIAIFQVKTGVKVKELRGHHDFIVDFAISDKGFVSVGIDGQVIVWNLETLKPQTIVHHPYGVGALFFKDRNHLITCNNYGTLYLWHLPTKKIIKTIKNQGRVIRQIRISNDDKVIGLLGSDYGFVATSLETWQPVLISNSLGWYISDVSLNNRVLAVSEQKLIELFPLNFNLQSFGGEDYLREVERLTGMKLKGFRLTMQTPGR